MKDEQAFSCGFQRLRDAKNLLSSCSEIFNKWKRSKRSMVPTSRKISLSLQGTTELLLICLACFTQGIFWTGLWTESVQTACFGWSSLLPDACEKLRLKAISRNSGWFTKYLRTENNTLAHLPPEEGISVPNFHKSLSSLSEFCSSFSSLLFIWVKIIILKVCKWQHEHNASQKHNESFLLVQLSNPLILQR